MAPALAGQVALLLQAAEAVAMQADLQHPAGLPGGREERLQQPLLQPRGRLLRSAGTVCAVAEPFAARTCTLYTSVLAQAE